MDDELSAARGIFNGVVIGVVVWACVGVLIWSLF